MGLVVMFRPSEAWSSTISMTGPGIHIDRVVSAEKRSIVEQLWQGEFYGQKPSSSIFDILIFVVTFLSGSDCDVNLGERLSTITVIGLSPALRANRIIIIAGRGRQGLTRKTDRTYKGGEC